MSKQINTCFGSILLRRENSCIAFRSIPGFVIHFEMEKDYRQFETLASTNGYAKENCTTFDKKKIVIIHALGQTKAYGQKKRSFLTPKNGGVWMSLCLYGAEDLDPIVATRKMANAAQNFLKKEKIEAKIKWPNDLLVESKKIAGILTEIANGWLIIGLGLNMKLTQEEMDSIDQPVTCVHAITNKNYDLKEVALHIVALFLDQRF